MTADPDPYVDSRPDAFRTFSRTQNGEVCAVDVLVAYFVQCCSHLESGHVVDVSGAKFASSCVCVEIWTLFYVPLVPGSHLSSVSVQAVVNARRRVVCSWVFSRIEKCAQLFLQSLNLQMKFAF